MFGACQNIPELAERGWLFRPVSPDSPEAQRMKQEYLYGEGGTESEERPQASSRPQPRELQNLLDRAEAGDMDAWWLLNREMTLQEHSTHYGDDVEAGLTQLPGWTTADESTQRRILQIARNYVSDYSPRAEKWVELTSSIYPTWQVIGRFACWWKRDETSSKELEPTHVAQVGIGHSGLSGATRFR